MSDMGLMGNELTKTAKEEINQSSKKKEIGLQRKKTRKTKKHKTKRKPGKQKI